MHNSSDTAVPCFSSISDDVKASSSFSFEFKLYAGPSSSGPSSHLVPAALSQIGLVSKVQRQHFSESSVPSSTLVVPKKPRAVEYQPSLTMNIHDLPISSADNRVIQDGQLNLGIPFLLFAQKDGISCTTAGGNTDEGYNWRKYGQKVVKGSEFPRSYYKCTYPNCEVKKIFERTPSGQMTEIVYKGSHDHPKPESSRHHNSNAIGTSQADGFSRTFSSFTCQDVEDKLDSDGIEQNLSRAVSPQQANKGLVNPSSQIHGANDKIVEEDQISKFRKIEDRLDFNLVVKPIREPRVIVQTTSEVDILDDGYRWRKYGQKVVRGNPNPRSYYKCTVEGCTVRKHVERACHDPKSVLTTYEGKHSHDLPTGRNANRGFKSLSHSWEKLSHP